ncbi:hypothetical protein PVL29_022527 [Vitis rotundifolia]|uniref:RRM domain-containing protein n=1 Tax=Vitis rotundifolia TaxID=103349 RepID=A0AA39DCU6_VITRO|nr:hypothetical protein PVL29_022527 [Vitis rotundifolia]
MAFFGKVGNILRQTVSKQVNSQFSVSNPSIYQAIRCMSSSKLFIGGLSYSTDDTSLREAFHKYGEVIEARVIVDRETGRSRGFGFITFTSSEEASSAIQALDGQDLHGRRVRVNYATDRARSGGFGGGGGYGGGGGGYGGGGYGGGGYGGSGGYGGGGYGGGSGGYGGGGDSYGSGGGNYGSGGGYGGSSGGYGTGGNFSVAGGSDNYVDGAAGSSSGFPSGGGSSFATGGADQFGTNESSSMGDGAGELSPDEPATEGNYRDDDEPDDYANRRA